MEVPVAVPWGWYSRTYGGCEAIVSLNLIRSETVRCSHWRTGQSPPGRFHEPFDNAYCPDGSTDYAGRKSYQSKREQQPQRDFDTVKREVHDGSIRIKRKGNAQLGYRFP
jgi:hypothetical protein